MIFSALRFVALSVAVLASPVAAGSTLYSDDQLESKNPHKVLTNGPYTFGITEHGKTYLKGCGKSKTLHDANTDYAVVKMQHDGNLVVYDLEEYKLHGGKPKSVWDSKTADSHRYKSKLVLGSDGYLKIYDVKKNKVIWTYSPGFTCSSGGGGGDDSSSGGDNCHETCKGKYLGSNKKLDRGELLCNDDMKFGLTCDGKWIYDNGHKVYKYGSIAEHRDGDISMQKDGNLVLYQFRRKHGKVYDIKALCSTHTSSKGAILLLTDDGPKIVSKSGKVIWDSDHVYC